MDMSTDTSAAETQTGTKVRKEKRPATIDHANALVKFEGADYEIADLSAEVLRGLALKGLAVLLHATKDPFKLMNDLRGGKLPRGRVAKVKDLDPWRKAYAHAVTDKRAKDDGIKARTPEFAALLAEQMAHAATIDRKALVKAKTIPAVVAHWARITGADTAL